MAGGAARAGVRHALLSAGHSSVLAVGGAARLADRLAVTALLSRRSAALSAPLRRARHERRWRAVLRSGRRALRPVIDPRTGWPARGRAERQRHGRDGARADALSTAFFVGGVELARRYCDAHPAMLVIFTPDDGARGPGRVGAYAGADVEVA